MKGQVLFEAKPLLKGQLDVETDAVINELNVSENGIYTPPSGVDGYAPVNVNVPIPEPVINELNVSENGTYTPPSGVDGYAPVNVNVPIPEPVINELNVSANGTYTPPSGVDGYAPVNVNVPEANLITLTANDNGIYTPGVGVDGYDEVIVNVQQLKYIQKNIVLINEQLINQGTITLDNSLTVGNVYLIVAYIKDYYNGLSVGTVKIDSGNTYASCSGGLQFVIGGSGASIRTQGSFPNATSVSILEVPAEWLVNPFN